VFTLILVDAIISASGAAVSTVVDGLLWLNLNPVLKAKLYSLTGKAWPKLGRY
jgi:hypothetical protein